MFKYSILPLLILSLLMVGCAPTTVPPTSTPEPATTLAATTAGSTTEVGVAPPPTPVVLPTLGPVTELPDDQAELLLYALLSEDTTISNEALRRIILANDRRYIPVFIELLFYGGIGVTPQAAQTVNSEMLELLTGQFYGQDWNSWVQWYNQQTDISLPPGFATWKGNIMGRIDANFRSLIGDEVLSTILVENIQWGGVAFDGIPSLDEPAMLTAAEATYLLPEEPVFGIAINGDARAYPLRIMDWHEMMNDTIGGVPVALAYCTLCGSGIAYLRTASDGETYTFGSSGLLYASNKLMFDRETQTLWNHLTGTAVYGELVSDDVALERLPVVLTSWADWQASHPETVVLDIDTGHERMYELGAAYGTYFEGDILWFPVWARSDALADKAQVFTLLVGGEPKAYPISVLATERVVNDVIGGVQVVIIAAAEPILVDGVDLRSGSAANYSAGLTVRAYESNGLLFRLFPDGELIDSFFEEWTITEVALLGPDGETLPRIGGHLAYWFGWYSFYPQTAIYGVE